MDHIGPHADHVDVHVPVEQDVVRQVFQGLAGQADHHSGAHLVAQVPEDVQTVLPHRPFMVPVLRMEGGIQSRIAGFDPQQIPVGPRFLPAPVGIFRLFPQAQGKPQFPVPQLLDVPDQAFHISDEFLILPFTGLEGQGPVLVVQSPPGHGQDVLPGGVEPFHFLIVPADTAVEAVFDAPVGKFQKAPVIGHPAHGSAFHRIGGVVEGLPVFRVGKAQQGNQVCPIQVVFVQQCLEIHTIPFFTLPSL